MQLTLVSFLIPPVILLNIGVALMTELLIVFYCLLDWFYIRSLKNKCQLVVQRYIFGEDGGSSSDRVTWRCINRKTNCPVVICLRNGDIAYIRGMHNHPKNYKIMDNFRKLSMAGMHSKYKITGNWSHSNPFWPRKSYHPF